MKREGALDYTIHGKAKEEEEEVEEEEEEEEDDDDDDDDNDDNDDDGTSINTTMNVIKITNILLY